MGSSKHEKTVMRTLSSRRAGNGRFDVVEDRVDLGDHEHTFYYVEIREGVCVLPFFHDQVVLLKEYRYPVHSYQWEIPGGLVEDNEDPADAAARELAEETGYIARELIPLGTFYTSFGMSSERIHLFAAHCDAQGETAREPEEILESYLVGTEEFREMIADGRFAHGAGLAAYARYHAMRAEEMRGSK